MSLHKTKKPVFFRAKGLMKKACIVYEDLNKSTDENENIYFKASTGWLRRFLSRSGFSLCRKTSFAQQDCERLLDKLVSFIITIRRQNMKFEYDLSNIIAMDETPVWSVMVSETTVAVKKIQSVLKTTGHEKSRVSVCLAAKADGTKVLPMIVFKGAKRESESEIKPFRTPIKFSR